MSDLVIRSGGAIEVDTASLRAAASRFRSLAGDADAAASLVSGAPEQLLGVPGAPSAGELLAVHTLLRDAAAHAGELAAALEEAAHLYEAVELLAQRAVAAAAGDAAAVDRLDARLERAFADRPDLARRAQELIEAGGDGSDLTRQVWWGSRGFDPVAGMLAPFTLAALGFGVDALGLGPVAARDRLTGSGDPVSVRALPTTSVAPPASLAAAAARIPGAGEGHVRVERYSMPNGTQQFAVYVTGTRSAGGSDPFDVRSNLQLYAGEKSASYEATLRALRDAGARPGDVVHAFGHSQGAMVIERLALEGPYDTRTLVSFGAPVQADVGRDTLAVTVRHTDDPIAALQGGGHPGSVGAPGSFVVERTADPMPGLHDATLPAHHMSAYAETAALVDGSDDPRAQGLSSVFDGLARAETAVAREYSAERVSPDGSGGR
ncbi:hypothetical protein F6B41_12590 [Microbacterium lushaniae]|nr:hypothetical protein F6B41_13770 [Microbacterium lushaniae]KAA9154629.1 hypothetical protein F6B41_12590 [Microbacterium lushaniae]